MQLNLDIDIDQDFNQAWLNYLTSMLNYKYSQITQNGKSNRHEPSLLIFKDESKSQPFIGIFEKQPESKMVLENNVFRTEYYVVGKPTDYRVFEVSKYGELVNSPAVPFSTKNFSWKSYLQKSYSLPPFDNEYILRSTIKKVHNEIYNATAKDPASAFDIISIILISKIYDELNQKHAFYIFNYEDKENSVTKVRILITEALEWAKLPFNNSQKEFYINLITSLPKHTLKRIFQLLRDNSLTTTATYLSGTDILGVIYEKIVSSTFRGELGSYFTPKQIVDFMIRFIGIEDNDKIFDPSCGSGGFLISSANYAKTKLLKSLTLYGNDINPRMVLATKLNYLIHNIGDCFVVETDGLELNQLYKNLSINVKVDDTKRYIEQPKISFFDKILANPPFAGFEKNKAILKKFDTAYNDNGSIKSLNKIIPFVELIVSCLKPGGKAGIVIPVSVLNAEEHSFVKLRALLINQCKVIAIIGLPKYAFVHTGCGVEGALIFIEKAKSTKNDYDIFIDWANHLGYDRLGKSTLENDFPRILKDFKSTKWQDKNIIKVSELSSDLRLDPDWWLYSKKSSKTVINQELINLGSLFDLRSERIQRKILDERTLYKYFEVGDTDINTGNITMTHTVSGYELKKKGRIKNFVREGDVLLPNHRDSLVAKTSKGAGRSAVIVDKDHDGYLTTDRFIVLTPKINPVVLREILNSEEIRTLLVSNSRGSASLDIRPNILLKIKISKRLTNPTTQREIISLHLDIENLNEQLAKKVKAIREIVNAAASQA